ncbi:hypothetical protein [Gemmata sp.]|uniref:hypothetical protein n=1 Tax=Gemmata sp. TaxID=1914242 RepID=UPI003F711139
MRVLFAFAALAALAAPAPAQPKPDRTWKPPADGVEVVAATFLGGKGTEWLASGGFQPDGRVVLVGNVLGPTFEVPVKVGVIGTDLPAPAEPKPVPAMDGNKPKVDKDGKPVMERPSWRHDGVTAFVALYSADLKVLQSVARFPWAAGAATAAAVGPDGSIYVAGRAGDGIAKLGGDMAELPAVPGDGKGARCRHSFVARLAPDATRAVWVRHVAGPASAPTVALAADGKVLFGAGNQHVLDAAGKLVATVTVPGGLKPTSSVSPTDGTVAVGGEHHWATGREPWRCPTLNLYTADGTLRHQLYDWGGPYVGLDNCRQVSDTAVRYVTHDASGGILMYLWSDGGNSVATTEPFDVRLPVKPKGLGLTAAGAGVLSCVYLIRLDPKDHHVTSWTFWSAAGSNNKPNSSWVDQMARAPDGSLAFAGRSAWGVWQTKDRLTGAEPQGDYVAVLSEDFTGLRFSSVVPGTGAAEVTEGASNRGSGWAVATGTVKGKSRVLFLAGATEGRKDGDETAATPTRNAAQEKFGGGLSDGYALLLELALPAAKPAPAPAPAAAPAPGGPTRAAFESARGRDPKAKPGPAPAEGTVFHFSPTFPKYVTVDAEMRDRTGKLWPAFLCGKPVDGTLTVRAGGPEAKLTVACTTLAQPNGDRGARLIGALVTDPKTPPPLTLAIDALGPQKSAEVKTTDNKGKEVVRVVNYHEAKGTLTLGDKKVAVAPKVTVGYAGPKDGPPDAVRLNAYVTLRAADLGLTGAGADGTVDVRVGMSGTLSAGPKPKK